MSDNDLPEVMRAARFMVSYRKPYYSHLLWAVIPRESTNLPKGSHAAVDKYGRLYFNRELMEATTTEQCAAIWVHEMNHLLLNHAGRQEDAKAFAMMVDPKTGAQISAWNIAGDMSINSSMENEKDDKRGDEVRINPLAKWMYPRNFRYPDGLLTEVYYDKLCKDTPPWKGPTGIAIGQCGSGADGQPKDYEDPAPERGGFTGKGATNHVPGLTAGESEAIRRAVAEEISKAPGTAPAWMELWATQLLKPIVDWRKLLAGLIRGSIATTLAGYAERTYRRPHRRYAATSVIMPTWYRPMPHLAVIGDTSGSMAGCLDRVLAEVDGICKAASAEIVFLSVDAAVGAVQKVANGREVKLVGGGGTDMRIGIDAACMLRPRPHLIIVITDCYTPWPDVAPPIPVIIANVTPGKMDDLPAWATVVDCSTEIK